MILQDTFTAADGSLLLAHTADSGATYGMNPAGAGVVTLNGGRARANAAAFAYSSVEAADCEISGVFRCQTVDGQYAGLLARMSTTTNSWYSLLLQFSGGITLYGSSSLGTYPVTFQAGVDYRVKLSLHGADLRAFLDGYEILRASNSSLSAAGRVGFCFGGSTTASTGLHLDSLSASTTFDTPQIQFVGDSLTIGAGVEILPHSDRYPTLAMDLAGIDADWANRGVSGRTLTTMLANVSAVDSCRRPNASSDIVVLWGGINDLAQGATAEQVIDRLMTYGDARRELGFQVVVLTIIAADEAHVNIPSGFNSLRESVNTWLRANWSDHFDALADVAAEASLANPLDTDYFQPDGVHLNAGGAAVVADVVAEQLVDLTEPGIVVTFPETGDVVLTGEPVEVTWDSTSVVELLNVELSTNGGTSFDETIAEGIENDGLFTWTPEVSQVTSEAILRVSTEDGLTSAESGEFVIATTTPGSGGLSMEQLESALASLRVHGDATWGSRPVLPVVARVNSEPVARTTLAAYQHARIDHQLIVVDSQGAAVNLSASVLQFSLETLKGALIASTGDIAVQGEGSNIVALTAEPEWHVSPGLYRYAVRDLSDGARVWARGDYVVEPTAGPVS